uniref:Uncharacterized protein n=1 Tax=Haplochromis burtoni TaxID=8153 RepID=A0A3Q2VD89_HAPBU
MQLCVIRGTLWGLLYSDPPTSTVAPEAVPRKVMSSPRRRSIIIYSFSCVPVFPVFPARSKPARSTRQKRLERSFIPVVPVCRKIFPISTLLSSSAAEVITTSLAPTTTGITQRDFLVNETRLLLPL